jgi:hypothetical protein
MIRYLPYELASSMTAQLSNQDGPLEKAYRELEDLRDWVRKAEFAAAAKSRRGLPSLSRQRAHH